MSWSKPAIIDAATIVPETTSGARRRQLLLTAGKLVLSISLITIVCYRAGFAATLAKLQTVSLHWLLLALLLYLSTIPVRAYRWQGLLRALGWQINLAQLSRLYLIGAFFNQLAPTGVGGDAMRAYQLAKDGVGGPLATNSVLVDRAAGLYSLLVMGVITLALRPELASRAVAIMLIGFTIAITIGALVCCWHARRRGLKDWPGWLQQPRWQAAQKFYQAFADYDNRALLKALLVSIGFNLQLIATNLLLAKAVGLQLSGWYFFLFIPLISAALVLPISVNGLGTREWSYVALFGRIGVSEPLALALSLAFYGLNLALALIGGGCWLLINLNRPRAVVLK